MLHELSVESGESITAIIADAVERYRRDRFLEAANAEWSAILADPVARAEIEAEDRLWEATHLDGLEDEEPWQDLGAERYGVRHSTRRSDANRPVSVQYSSVPRRPSTRAP
jgi:hypothetical protein